MKRKGNREQGMKEVERVLESRDDESSNNMIQCQSGWYSYNIS